MVEHERGAYDPTDDIRVFDGSREDEEEGFRLPILIATALVVLAAFAGVVWLAYEKGVASGRSEPQIVAANPQEDAAQPDHAPMRYKGLKVYDQPAPDNADQAVPSLPPPAAKTAQSPSAAPKVSAPAFRPPVTEPAPANPSPPRMAVVTGTQAAPVSKPAPVALAPSPAAAQAVSGAFLLQIGSYKSQAEADAAWSADKAKYGDLLSGLQSNVQQVDLGARGTWYRLRIASFTDKTVATALCEKLKAGGATCLLTR
jgi:cell division protein FtsN